MRSKKEQFYKINFAPSFPKFCTWAQKKLLRTSWPNMRQFMPSVSDRIGRLLSDNCLMFKI
jgi:hypothetical protein